LLYPRGPRSGPSYSVSAHHHLLAPSVPLAGTSRFRRLAAYTRCPRCAFPPRRPASGSVLSLYIPSPHAALFDRGEFIGCTCSVPSPMTSAFAQSPWARHSQNSHHPFPMGGWFRGFTGSLLAAACRVACPPDGSDRAIRPANGDFYSRASSESVTLLAVGYNYGGN
jgi:hypothetical protein